MFYISDSWEFKNPQKNYNKFADKILCVCTAITTLKCYYLTCKIYKSSIHFSRKGQYQ